jgi:hypothetical protein
MVFILLVGHCGWFIWWRKSIRRLRRCQPAAASVASNHRASLIRLKNDEVNSLPKAEHIYHDLVERKKIGNLNYNRSTMIKGTDHPEAVELQRKKKPVAVSVPAQVVHFAASASDGGHQRSITSLPTNSLELLPIIK